MIVEITKKAVKELDRIPDRIAKNISRHVLELSRNPFPANSTKLQGSNNYRLRIGVYRVIYFFDPKKTTIIILRVAHRRQVYR